MCPLQQTKQIRDNTQKRRGASHCLFSILNRLDINKKCLSDQEENSIKRCIGNMRNETYNKKNSGSSSMFFSIFIHEKFLDLFSMEKRKENWQYIKT
ncbi:hypothetical protein BpHYR1_009602 [Brachionus plicatilis]|uniref:Uncharacterized protein n=1 Tax=Brachionus plicatilis TaxID=10195 RepID=A0A3M7T5L6_BRAPC|nr:hypothetical protein BpHYR1_009602 [Brachionus plicatilis]